MTLAKSFIIATTTVFITIATGCSGIPVGTVAPYLGTDVPKEWLVADGQEINRSQYGELCKVLDDRFGSADQKDRCKLPDLRNKFLRGAARDNSTIIETNNSSHFHSASLSGSAQSCRTTGCDGWQEQRRGSPASTGWDHTHPVTVSGSTGTVNHIPPSTTVLYIIKAKE